MSSYFHFLSFLFPSEWEVESWAQKQRREGSVRPHAAFETCYSNNRWRETSGHICDVTKPSNHVMCDTDYKWVKQMSPRVDRLFITGAYFMSNQNCGWKRETTVCHSWISKDGDLAAWLERTNQAEWRYEISWVQYESGVSHSPDKTPTL